MWKRFVLMVFVVLGPVSGAGAVTAGGPGNTITVTPAEGAPFTVVDVSGANCTEGPSPSVAGTLAGPPDVGVIASFVATPDVAGNWASSFTVPPNQPAGGYEVTAECKTDPDAIEGVDYEPQAFSVLEGERATMDVSTRPGQGTDVIVEVTGDLCRGTDPSVEIRAFVRGSDADEFVAQEIVTPNAEGMWSGELVLPDASGTYGVSGQCSLAAMPFILYDTVDLVFAVGTPIAPPVAPPAAPLPGEPTFTG